MPTNVAMLRGVNVGARNKLAMNDLEALFVALGHTSVVTYIQSGNVVFHSRSSRAVSVVQGIEDRLARDLGLQVAVLLRTKDELGDVARSNPFVRTGADPACLHVTFLAEVPDPGLVRTVETFDGAPDELRVRGRDVFVHCPTGYGNTKLNNGFLERKLHATATTRNWKTVTKLVELAG
jgi:uncharacterized protein (DUF1697 family)